MRLYYAENDKFYKELDAAVRGNEVVSIVFQNQKIDVNAKIWKRLRKCKNWSEMEAKLRNPESASRENLKGYFTPGVVGLLATEALLIAFIATLISGLVFYAIYKNKSVSLKVDSNGTFAMEFK